MINKDELQAMTLKQFSDASEKMPLILYAAKHGMLGLLAEKLDKMDATGKEAVLSLSNLGGLTPLHYTALYGQTETAKLLLAHGASPLSQSLLGQTPIMSLFSTNNNTDKILEMFSCLTADPAVYAVCNRSGDTVAHAAADRGIVTVLEAVQKNNPMLLDNKNNQGVTPLLRAILSNQEEAASYLLDHSNREAVDTHGRNALHYAVLYANARLLEKVATTFAHSGLMHHRDRDGKTAMEIALARNDDEKTGILKPFCDESAKPECPYGKLDT